MGEQDRIEAQTPGWEPGAAKIVVTVPTFRRPAHLQRTLASLRAQRDAGAFAVLVIDNDAEGREGLDAARRVFEDGTLNGAVMIAHERGSSSAYNAGWAMALARFPAMEHLLVIDDDEIASPDWIARMLAAARQFDAEIVGGPVRPVFEDEAGARWQCHPVFQPAFRESGPVPILYGVGNLFLARRVLEVMDQPYLDPTFNFIGGGDADFFSRCQAKGLRFAWCHEAELTETTPARRTEFSWIAARALRNGAISAIVERRRHGRRASLLRSTKLLVASPFRAALLAVKTRSAAIGLHPLQVALGRWQGELGWVQEQYRRPEAN